MTSQGAPIAILGGTPEDDHTLVRRSLAGDDAAFRILVERYQGGVYNLALRSMGDDSVAREVTQEAFVRLFRSMKRLRFEAALETWLFRVTVNLCRDRWRRIRKEEKMVPLDALRDRHEAVDPTLGPEEALARRDAGERVSLLLLQLSCEQRETLILSYINGLTHDEIARTVGCPRGTVASRIHRGLRALGQLVSREGRHGQ